MDGEAGRGPGSPSSSAARSAFGAGFRAGIAAAAAGRASSSTTPRSSSSTCTRGSYAELAASGGKQSPLQTSPSPGAISNYGSLGELAVGSSSFGGSSSSSSGVPRRSRRQSRDMESPPFAAVTHARAEGVEAASATEAQEMRPLADPRAERTGVATASARSSMFDGECSFPIGTRVALRLGDGAEEAVGTVRFVGSTTFSSGTWVGISLDEPLGKNDGSLLGTCYFRCAPRHGVFARPGMLRAGGPDASMFEEQDTTIPADPDAHAKEVVCRSRSSERRANLRSSLASASTSASSVRSSLVGAGCESEWKFSSKDASPGCVPDREALCIDASAAATPNVGPLFSTSRSLGSARGCDVAAEDVRKPDLAKSLAQTLVDEAADQAKREVCQRLALAAEEHDEEQLRQLIPEAWCRGVDVAELQSAQKVLNFEIQRGMKGELDSLCSRISRLSDSVARVETQATDLARSAPDRWFSELTERLERRIWDGVGQQVQAVVRKAVKQATDDLKSERSHTSLSPTPPFAKAIGLQSPAQPPALAPLASIVGSTGSVKGDGSSWPLSAEQPGRFPFGGGHALRSSRCEERRSLSPQRRAGVSPESSRSPERNPSARRSILMDVWESAFHEEQQHQNPSGSAQATLPSAEMLQKTAREAVRRWSPPRGASSSAPTPPRNSALSVALDSLAAAQKFEAMYGKGTLAVDGKTERAGSPRRQTLSPNLSQSTLALEPIAFSPERSADVLPDTTLQLPPASPGNAVSPVPQPLPPLKPASSGRDCQRMMEAFANGDVASLTQLLASTEALPEAGPDAAQPPKVPPHAWAEEPRSVAALAAAHLAEMAGLDEDFGGVVAQGVREAGGIPLLMRLLGSPHADASQRSILALAALLQHDDAQATCASAMFSEGVLPLLTRHCGSLVAGLKRSAAAAAGLLVLRLAGVGGALAEDCRCKFADSGGIGILVDLLAWPGQDAPKPGSEEKARHDEDCDVALRAIQAMLAGSKGEPLHERLGRQAIRRNAVPRLRLLKASEREGVRRHASRLLAQLLALGPDRGEGQGDTWRDSSGGLPLMLPRASVA
eukprot:TRINITY_DN50318_c0_g1_i1.p1 TRINITY_DN50318_c0_g1~~TRINITY_DN50318_c0_g1_i1.p1  ORF type:complete len:1069 (+),score=250.64 TRINITY_DN50318_c0_g1_i1:118-3324(+)